MRVQCRLHGLAWIPISGVPDVVESEHGPAAPDPDTLHDPFFVRADIELLEKAIRDLVFGMEVAEAVHVQGHREAPEMRSPPSTLRTLPLIQAASGSDNK